MIAAVIADLRKRFNQTRGKRGMATLEADVLVNRMTLNNFAGGGRVSTQVLERIEAWVEKQEERKAME